MGQFKLVRADKDLREVDFEIVNPEEAPKTKIRVPRNDEYRGRGRGRRDVPIIIPVMRIIMVTITVILKENGVALIKKTDIKIIVK